MDALAHHLALALGGRPAAGLAARLMLPLSKRGHPTKPKEVPGKQDVVAINSKQFPTSPFLN